MGHSGRAFPVQQIKPRAPGETRVAECEDTKINQVLHSKRTSPAKTILQAAPVGFFLSKEGVLLSLAINRNRREEWEEHCSRGV